MTLPNFLSDAGAGISYLLLDMALKGVLILILTSGLMLLLRRSAATVRHAVWAVALCSLLLIPVLSLTLPSWHVAVLPADSPTVVQEDAVVVEPLVIHHDVFAPESEIAPVLPVIETPDDSVLPSEPAQAAEAVPAHVAAPTFKARMVQTAFAAKGMWTGIKSRVVAAQNWWMANAQYQYMILLMVWLVGMGMVLLRLVFGMLGIAWMGWRSRPVKDHAWLSILDEISARYGLKKPVQLRKSYTVRMPVTWGARRPVVLLPADADTWSEERRRVVLMHELAHIKRRDWLTQSLAQLACAVHWFNPLAWLALRQLRKEHELACDDEVLLSGLKPSTYAGHLLEIARTFWTARLAAPAALAVARRSAFEDRMRAILDPKRRRQVLSRAVWFGTGVVIAMALVPLAAMQLDRASVEEAPEAAPAVSLMQPVVLASIAETMPVVAPDEEVCKEVNETYDLNAEGELTLSNLNGEVFIDIWDRNEARIDAIACAYSKVRLDEVNIEISSRANTLRIESKYEDADWSNRPNLKERQPAWVNYTLRVPRRVELASVSLVNGDLSVQDLEGPVRAQTVNGTLLALNLEGEAELSTVNGKLEARFEALDPSATINLSTVNGSVTLTLPNDADANISASTLSGSIRNAYGMKVRRGRYVGRSMDGQIGNGGAEINLESVNGRLRIQRADGQDLGLEIYGSSADLAERRAARDLRYAERDRVHARAQAERVRTRAARDAARVQARAHAQATRQAQANQKEALRELVRAEQRALRSLQRAERAEMEGLSRDERARLKAEIKAERKRIKAEMKAERERVKDEMRALRETLRDQEDDWDNDNDWDDDNDKDWDEDEHVEVYVDPDFEASAEAFAEIATSLGVAASEAGLDAAREALSDLEDELADLDINLSVETDDDSWHFELEGEDLEAVGNWLDQTVSHLVASTLDAVDTAHIQAEVSRATADALHEAQFEMLEALDELPDDFGTPHLERLARTHPDASVRRAAKALLEAH